ncbi:MAG: 4-diphosphocytidyl-2-C-methyl-D-erythritol kinase [Alphaproteobacteria bacterium]|jgi:4-diphosphocytidyl-2-C-methyl-D-erythritol kinase|nr:4-diphosphocytidyl-2-C-methyl-D-erythritol kinase [Alphaproteobacteria bacterium]
MMPPLVERAPAKVNLTLRLRARRDDGWHEIESLVAFAQVADRLTLKTGHPLGLAVRGADREACGPVAGNLIIKAAQALAARIPNLQLGHFILLKRIPVAGGLGGGSSDAAAALRLLARANDLAPDDARLVEAAREIGADVPVCLDTKPRVMRGIGDLLSEPTSLPKLAAVLVNPGVPLATNAVFAAFDRAADLEASPYLFARSEISAIPHERKALLAFLEQQPNDLEPAAISRAPVIADVLSALRGLPECRLARMSGSGATCFVLCDSARAAKAVAARLAADHPGWWVRATTLGAA